MTEQALITIASVTFYLAMGIASGAMASRIAYRKTRPAKKDEYAKWWGWSTLFAWPIVGVCYGIYGFGYGIYRMLNRVIIPAEAR